MIFKHGPVRFAYHNYYCGGGGSRVVECVKYITRHPSFQEIVPDIFTRR